MHTRHRSLLRSALVAALVMGLVGCSRGDDTTMSTSATTSSTISTSTATATPTTTPTTMPSPTTAITTTEPPTPTSATSTSTMTVPATTTARPVPPSTTVAPAGPARVVSIADTDEPVVALTFDAGSDAGHTRRILDELSAHRIRAAFALTGEWVEHNPDLARRIVNEGHDIMNHSYDHPSFTGVSSDDVALTSEERWRQLDRTEELIRTVTGATSLPYFRPPFGDHDESVARDAGVRGYRFLVMWTVDSLGWKGLAPSEVVVRCVERAQPGAILMFHVGSASTDADALPELIDQLTAAGYRFRSLPLLLG